MGSTRVATFALCWVFPLFCIALQNVRVVTWNTLAQCYIHAEDYPWCTADDLSWEHRSQIIRKDIANTDADIVCLQEMQVDLWPAFAKEMAQLGYSRCILQTVKRNHPVACAVLLKDSSGFEFRRTESRSRALICVLSSGSKENLPPIYVVSVHFEAGRRESETRLYQMKSLWKRLRNHFKLDSVQDDESQIIMAGDFNLQRKDDLYKNIHQGKLKPTKSMKLRDSVQIEPFQDVHKGRKVWMLPLGKFVSRIEKSYRGGAVIDYVLVSRSISVDRPLGFHGSSTTFGWECFPSSEHPSDHFMIGADLSFR